MTRWSRAAAGLLAPGPARVLLLRVDNRTPRRPGRHRRQPTPGHRPTPDLARFYDQQLDWRDCKGHFECSRLLVPLDYTDPDGATIKLGVNRLPAAGERVGSLLVNPGGPGVSGLDYARSAGSIVSKKVRAAYDVVGFDPRGVAASAGLDCLSDRQLDAFLSYDGTPDDSAEEQGLMAVSEQLGEGCERDDARLLPHVGTRDAARDLDVLRAALGDRQLTYLGKSYGTYLGAIYADLFPNRVGRLVLDGPIDPAATAYDVAELQAIGFQRAIGAFIDDCLPRRSCPFGGDRAAAEARLAALFDQLDRSPLPGIGKRQLTESLGTVAVAVALYDESSWSFLRQALRRAFGGDGTTLMLLADYYADRGPGGRYTTDAIEAMYAVNCIDRPQVTDLEQVRADAAKAAVAAPLFGAYIVWSALPCSSWPAPAQGEPTPVTAAGSQPILVVGTTRDPATPYEWAESLADELDAGHLLTYVGDGHTAYRRGSRCVDDVVDAYLLEGTTPAAGTRCR